MTSGSRAKACRLGPLPVGGVRGPGRLSARRRVLAGPAVGFEALPGSLNLSRPVRARRSQGCSSRWEAETLQRKECGRKTSSRLSWSESSHRRTEGAVGGGGGQRRAGSRVAAGRRVSTGAEARPGSRGSGAKQSDGAAGGAASVRSHGGAAGARPCLTLEVAATGRGAVACVGSGASHTCL